MAFAIGFGVLGAIGGFVLGFGLSAFDELILNKGNPQGAVAIPIDRAARGIRRASIWYL